MFDPIHISNAQPSSLINSWFSAYSIAKKSQRAQKPIPTSDQDTSTPLLQERKKKAVFGSIFNSIKQKVINIFKTSDASDSSRTTKSHKTKTDGGKTANLSDPRSKNKKKSRTYDSTLDDIDFSPIFHNSVIQTCHSIPIEVEELFLDDDGGVLITSALISAGKKLIDFIGEIDFDN